MNRLHNVFKSVGTSLTAHYPTIKDGLVSAASLITRLKRPAFCTSALKLILFFLASFLVKSPHKLAGATSSGRL